MQSHVQNQFPASRDRTSVAPAANPSAAGSSAAVVPSAFVGLTGLLSLLALGACSPGGAPGGHEVD